MRILNPGLFRHRITIQNPVEVKDELGQAEITWQDTNIVWAMIKTTQGREYFAAAATKNENTTRFVIRYTNGVEPNMRILYQNRVYEIESVINDEEMNKTLTIIAKG